MASLEGRERKDIYQRSNPCLSNKIVEEKVLYVEEEYKRGAAENEDREYGKGLVKRKKKKEKAVQNFIDRWQSHVIIRFLDLPSVSFRSQSALVDLVAVLSLIRLFPNYY